MLNDVRHQRGKAGSSSRSEAVLAFALTALQAEDRDELLSAAVRTATAGLPAEAAAVLAVQDEVVRVVAGPEHQAWTPLSRGDTRAGLLQPLGEAGLHLAATGVRRLRGGAQEQSWLALGEALRCALQRLAREEVLRSSVQHLADSQRLAHMGNYDWEIASDTNTWSDELYRIYGHEPQSFNASYERFLACIHPDDRERVIAVHRDAYAAGGTYAMRERVVRPDGEVRTLMSTGEVVLGPDGAPARMRGTCLDITEREQAERSARQTVEQMWDLVGVLPTPVLAIDDAGVIARANPAAQELLATAGDDLVGTLFEDVVPETGLPETLGVTLSARALTAAGVVKAQVRAVPVDTAEGRLAVVSVTIPQTAVPVPRGSVDRGVRQLR